MIISFGISWPMNIIKSYRTKSTKGKSLLFLLFIDFGYICGVVGKIVGNNITWVFAFYVLNLVMVSWDLILYFINYTREKKRAALAAEGAGNVQAEAAEQPAPAAESAADGGTDGAEQTGSATAAEGVQQPSSAAAGAETQGVQEEQAGKPKE